MENKAVCLSCGRTREEGAENWKVTFSEKEWEVDVTCPECRKAFSSETNRTWEDLLSKLAICFSKNV